MTANYFKKWPLYACAGSHRLGLAAIGLSKWLRQYSYYLLLQSAPQPVDARIRVSLNMVGPLACPLWLPNPDMDAPFNHISHRFSDQSLSKKFSHLKSRSCWSVQNFKLSIYWSSEMARHTVLFQQRHSNWP